MDNIQQKASELLRSGKVRRPPVPVERIAGSLGIAVHYSPSKDDVSGALVRKGKHVLIGVNSFHHVNRQRFTIAHELGHFLLHKGVQFHVDEDFRVNWRTEESSQATNWEEIQANRFAAELLMPVEFLERDLVAHSEIDEYVIRDLATKYKVSPQSMQIRLTNLGYVIPY